MIRGRHVHSLFSDYIDGSLSAGQVKRVEAHLAQCPACARELAEWRAVLRLVATHAPVRCPIDCASAVIEQLAARAEPAHRPAAPMRRGGSLAPWALASGPALAAAVAAILLLGGASWLRGAAGNPGARLIAALWPASGRAHVSSALPLTGSRSERAPESGGLALVGFQSPSGRPFPVSNAALKAATPDRVDEAFGHSDSLILAADFAEDDR